MLRTIIEDDEKWRQILRGLNKTFYHQTVTYQDIINYINKNSGLDFTKVFQQYLQHRSIPTLEIKLDDKNNVLARWISEVPQFEMPVHLGEKGKKMQRYSVGSTFKSIGLQVDNIENLDIDTFNYYIGVMKQ